VSVTRGAVLLEEDTLHYFWVNFREDMKQPDEKELFFHRILDFWGGIW